MTVAKVGSRNLFNVVLIAFALLSAIQLSRAQSATPTPGASVDLEAVPLANISEARKLSQSDYSQYVAYVSDLWRTYLSVDSALTPSSGVQSEPPTQADPDDVLSPDQSAAFAAFAEQMFALNDRFGLKTLVDSAVATEPVQDGAKLMAVGAKPQTQELCNGKLKPSNTDPNVTKEFFCKCGAWRVAREVVYRDFGKGCGKQIAKSRTVQYQEFRVTNKQGSHCQAPEVSNSFVKYDYSFKEGSCSKGGRDFKYPAQCVMTKNTTTQTDKFTPCSGRGAGRTFSDDRNIYTEVTQPVLVCGQGWVQKTRKNSVNCTIGCNGRSSGVDCDSPAGG